MKHARAFALACLIALGLAVSGCGGSSSPTDPTPAPASTTETFSGSIDIDGVKTYLFTVNKPGNVEAKLLTETVTVDGATTPSTVALGFDLGYWTGTTCVMAYRNAAATAGATLTAVTTQTGYFCVRIYDVGNITQGVPISFTGSIAHP